MKIVYSYWETSNGLNFIRHWDNPQFMIACLIISVLENHKNYGNVEMITDSISKEWIEKLELPFNKISTNLDELSDFNRNNWSLGKIKAYSLQTEPFIHVDNDVIMHGRFSEDFLNSDIGVQNYEYFSEHGSQYVDTIDFMLKNTQELPENFGVLDYSFNMGVYSCNNLKMNKEYTEFVLNYVKENEELFLKNNQNLSMSCLTFEQYLLPVFAKNNNCDIKTIKASDTRTAYEGGYRHLLDIKKDKKTSFAFLELLNKSYHSYYLNMMKIFNST